MKSGMTYVFQLIQAGKLFEAIEILSNATVAGTAKPIRI